MTVNRYNITRQEDGTTSVSAYVGGKMQVANSDHPNFQQICATLVLEEDNNEAKVLGLFDIPFTIGQVFKSLSDRVKESGGKIYFDGKIAENVLTEQILLMLQAGEDIAPLVNFYEKVETNPNEHSKENLYRWMKAQQDTTNGTFTLAPDGDFYAYKGLRNDGRSINAGGAFVDGVWVEGNVPNEIGSIIEMPRDHVQHDPSVGCAVGLHAGTWSYANGFGHGLTRQVKINPRDVVSVPTDSGDAKMRVSRYEVIKDVVNPNARPVQVPEDLDDYEDIEEEYEFVDEEEELHEPDHPLSRLRRFFKKGV